MILKTADRFSLENTIKQSPPSFIRQLGGFDIGQVTNLFR